MKILVTGSCGLIGSEAVTYFDNQEHEVLGLDNNMRKDFFGSNGDTSRTLASLKKMTNRFRHFPTDIRDRETILQLVAKERPDAIIHCAAQPSHDLAASRPFDDFDVNAVGTLNLLEACRQHTPDSPFVFLSTNKVYGDSPNEIPIEELRTRWDYINPDDYGGITENCRIDQSKHSLFGASKVAADILTQEYGRYFGMPTVAFRGGCLTGPNHKGVELHGFLSYLTKVAVHDECYTIFGYNGKQVRDQIHSLDVVRAIDAFIAAPRIAEVYNIGGGRRNSISILECIAKLEALTGRPLRTAYREVNRQGDHICYISNLSKFTSHYPSWNITRPLDNIIEEMFESEVTGQEN